MTPWRFFNWRSRLSAYVGGCLHLPFSWGEHDCVLFAAGGVEAMTGIDLAEGFRGHYATSIGAKRALRNAGHKELDHLVAAHFPEVPPALASEGDIAVLWNADRQMLGLIVGEMIAAPGQMKLEFVPRSDAQRAFHVPFNGDAD